MTKHVHTCAECQRLQSDVQKVLESLTLLTAAQLAAFRASDQETLCVWTGNSKMPWAAKNALSAP